MLAAAVEMVTLHGLTVSLDHIRLDEVIEAAGVARTSAYRRWPYKDLFIADLLVELARASGLGSGWGTTDELIVETLSEMLPRPSDVSAAQDRTDVVVEVLRVSAQADVEDVHTSPHWRTHIALQATLLGLPDGELRTTIASTLRRSEERFGAVRAASFRRLAELWGYRPVDFDGGGDGRDAPDAYDQLATSLSSTMTGLVIRATSDPGLVTPSWRIAPFGTTRRAAWSTPALALVQVVLSHLEPGSADDWGDRRIRAAIDEIRELRASAEAHARRHGDQPTDRPG